MRFSAERPRCLRRLNPEIPPKLEEIITRRWRRTAKLRYQNAAELRADLKRLKRDTDSGRSVASAKVAEALVTVVAQSNDARDCAAVLVALLAAAGWFYKSAAEQRRDNRFGRGAALRECQRRSERGILERRHHRKPDQQPVAIAPS